MKTTAQRIEAKCQEIAAFLLAKNASYGDSALFPTRIFSRADAAAGLRVRIDDKLSRIAAQPGAFGDNDVQDLTGYLVLLLIDQDLARERAAEGGAE